MAFFFAGIPLRTDKQLLAGEAISADFTGEGWRMHNRDDRTPVFTPREAGRHLARLALQVDFSAVDHWPTDYAGHRGDHTAAVRLMEVLDEVLAGIIEESKGTPLTTIVSSDHGNMEDLGARGHTRHPVPALVFGPAETRAIFFRQKRDLTGFGAAILEVMRYSASA